MTFGSILLHMRFEHFLPAPHEPRTNVLAIAIPFKISPGRSCIQYCGVAVQLVAERLR
jgi:hypothetical protein